METALLILAGLWIGAWGYDRMTQKNHLWQQIQQWAYEQQRRYWVWWWQRELNRRNELGAHERLARRGKLSLVFSSPELSAGQQWKLLQWALEKACWEPIWNCPEALAILSQDTRHLEVPGDLRNKLDKKIHFLCRGLYDEKPPNPWEVPCPPEENLPERYDQEVTRRLGRLLGATVALRETTEYQPAPGARAILAWMPFSYRYPELIEDILEDDGPKTRARWMALEGVWRMGNPRQAHRALLALQQVEPALMARLLEHSRHRWELIDPALGARLLTNPEPEARHRLIRLFHRELNLDMTEMEGRAEPL